MTLHDLKSWDGSQTKKNCIIIQRTYLIFHSATVLNLHRVLCNFPHPRPTRRTVRLSDENIACTIKRSFAMVTGKFLPGVLMENHRLKKFKDVCSFKFEKKTVRFTRWHHSAAADLGYSRLRFQYIRKTCTTPLILNMFLLVKIRSGYREPMETLTIYPKVT